MTKGGRFPFEISGGGGGQGSSQYNDPSNRAFFLPPSVALHEVGMRPIYSAIPLVQHYPPHPVRCVIVTMIVFPPRGGGGLGSWGAAPESGTA